MASILSTLARNFGPRTRTVLRYVGFAVLGLVTFVFAFQLAFPWARVKDKAIELLADKYDVTIGGVEGSILPGRMYFKAVSIRTRPAKAGDVATTFYMDQLGVDLGLFAALHGALSVKLDVKIGPGRARGKIELGKDGTTIQLDGDDLPSASLPVREALGLPMSGKVRLALALDLPNEKAKGTGKAQPSWTKADGHLELACPSGCTVGDGKSKLRLSTKDVRQQAFLDESGGGIDFGKVNIDSLLADVEVKGGKLSITRFDVKSGDGELHVAFDLALNQDLLASQVTGCLRFRGSDALLKREPKTHAAFSTTGGPMGPDGLFHIKLEGQLRAIRRLPYVCGPAAGTSTETPGAAPARPNLPVPTEAPAKPAGTVTLPTPTSPPPPTPAPPATPPAPEPGGAPQPMPSSGSPGEGPAPVVVPTPGAQQQPPPPGPAQAPGAGAPP